LLPLVLDYDRSVVVARKRRRDLIVGLTVIAAARRDVGIPWGLLLRDRTNFPFKWGNPSPEERVERILTGLVVAVLVASGIVIGGRSDESARRRSTMMKTSTVPLHHRR
jgi:hypothetical protein